MLTAIIGKVNTEKTLKLKHLVDDELNKDNTK